MGVLKPVGLDFFEVAHAHAIKDRRGNAPPEMMAEKAALRAWQN